MFYSDSFSDSYRLGDVIKGYSEIIPTYPLEKNELTIKIAHHKFFVILTPCCSIEGCEAIIAPLKQIDQRFLLSDFIIKHDFLVINNKMKRIDAVGEVLFGTKTPKEQEEIIAAEENYEFKDIFVYDGNVEFEPYNITRKKSKLFDELTINTNKYIVSFKDAMRTHCNSFIRNNNQSEKSSTICEKILELTPQTRSELRNKLSAFYSDVPKEDKPYIT